MKYKVQVINHAGAERYKHCGITPGMRVSGISRGATHEGPYYVFDKNRLFPFVHLESHEFEEVHDFMNAQGQPVMYPPVHLPYNFASMSPLPSGGAGSTIIPIASGVYQTAMDENAMVGKNLMQRHAMMLAYQKRFTEEKHFNIESPTLCSTHGRKRLTKSGAKRFAEYGAKEGMWVGVYRRDKQNPSPLTPEFDKTYTFIFDQGLMLRCQFRLNDEDTYLSFEEPDICISSPLLGVVYSDHVDEITVTRSVVFRPFYDYPSNVFVFEASVPQITENTLQIATNLVHSEMKWNLSTMPTFADLYIDGNKLSCEIHNPFKTF